MGAGNLPTPGFRLDAVPPDRFPLPAKPSPRFAVSQSTWVVRTESNVRKEEKRRPHPSCVDCRGSGKADCRFCCGRGRTNCVEQVMLPRGEWPKWCKICGGSGLDYCSRCVGTGEFRDIMGFHFMKMDPSTGGNNKQSK
ncbi:hypothetical protein H6P81_005139 [Aristolochia fimbriata]|uniref:Uncharacterized protein n=1 Tax=Aristolochia fimbriata TaxID=158543 RepID=A0AAV7ETK7_ARIFI|nr:hypothetical protein H6P81_005139 [Aristolochia fimbriata]